MLLNHLTFYFYNISSPSYSSRSHPLLPAPFFPFSHPGMSPIQAGRPSLLPVARGHCHKRREDLNLINDQHESGQPASSIKSWSTLHWMYTFECVPVCVCVCVHRMSSMDIMWLHACLVDRGSIKKGGSAVQQYPEWHKVIIQSKGTFLTGW